MQEGAAKDVALTYHIKENHDEDAGLLKYSFATPPTGKSLRVLPPANNCFQLPFHHVVHQ
jgi:hypothetical protein